MRGDIAESSAKPDGMPVKRLDVSRLNDLGWRASTPLREGIERTYAWYAAQVAGAVRGGR